MAGGNSVRFTATIDDKVSGKLGIIGGKFDKTFGKGSAASLFGNVGAKAVAGGFNLISTAIGGTLGFLGDSVTAFNEDAQSQALFHQALQNNIEGWKFSQKAVDDYVDSQIELGFVDDDVRASLSQLVGVTHDAGKAMELNTLAQDLARAKGIDLATATDIVTKAAQGNGKALKALGIDVGKTTDAATLLDKIQQNVEGSASTWANTTSGKLQIAQDKFNEATEKLGGVIMPVLADVMTKATDEWLPAFGRGVNKVNAFLSDMIDRLNRGIRKIQDFFKSLASLAGPMIGPPGHQVPNPNYVPPHAQGGMVGLNGPEMIMVGERGPEQVIANRSSGGGGGTGVTIVGVSEKDIIDMVDRGLYFKLRRAQPAPGVV